MTRAIIAAALLLAAGCQHKCSECVEFCRPFVVSSCSPGDMGSVTCVCDTTRLVRPTPTPETP